MIGGSFGIFLGGLVKKSRNQKIKSISNVHRQKCIFSQIRLVMYPLFEVLVLDVEDLFGFVDAAICDLNNAPCSFY